jgi:RND family efflux transporter MFP subunit
MIAMESPCRNAFVVVGLALLGACGGDAPPAAPPARTIAVATVAEGPALPPVLINGTIATREELRLSFKIAGIVGRIEVDAGERVRAGQTLATLELAEIDAQVAQARQLAAKAERDRARAARLRADEVISQEELEALETQAEVARAQLRAAEFNRRYAAIIAPRDGIVLRKRVEAREFVAAGQTVLELGPLAGGYVARASLADRDVVRLSLGDPVAVTVDAWPGTVLRGRVTEIAGAAGETTGLFDIEAELDDARVTLVTGLVARLQIDPASSAGQRLPHVPIAALVDADGDRGAVFVVREGIAHRQPVQVAWLGPQSVAIVAGVAPGAVVATGGALYLDDGDRVDVVDTPAGDTTTARE